ncbi:MAG TPA: long-chain fatty acid--CoA ligase, partial [Butyricimonas virosa]|nr:long-chain fatty acid--CoA ligase [Butyricimonas virosa]
MEESFIYYIESSIKENWDRPALTDYHGINCNYKDVARKIEKLHILFEHAGIKKGDKIALCGRNSTNWGIAFLATLTYGAVVVPILNEFKPDNIHNIVNHSESRLLFVGSVVWEGLNEASMEALEGILSLEDNSILVSRSQTLSHARVRLNELFGKKYPDR